MEGRKAKEGWEVVCAKELRSRWKHATILFGEGLVQIKEAPGKLEQASADNAKAGVVWEQIHA